MPPAEYFSAFGISAAAMCVRNARLPLMERSILPCHSALAGALLSDPKPARMFRAYSSETLKRALHALWAGNVSRFFGAGFCKKTVGNDVIAGVRTGASADIALACSLHRIGQYHAARVLSE